MKISHEQWMQDTAAFGRIRSKELKAVDAALKTFRDAENGSVGSILKERQALKKALDAWKSSDGANWRSSVRNKQRAIERLDAELGHVIAGKGGLSSRGELMIDPKELAAARELARMIKANTRTMFQGQKLTVKSTAVLADLKDVQGAYSEFKSKATEIGGALGGAAPKAGGAAKAQVEGLLTSLFGDAPLSEVQQALGPLSTNFVSSVTPFVGAISSGGKAIMKWAQAAKTLYKRSGMKDATLSFAPGDPAAAFDAILVIMAREATAHATAAGIHTVSAAAKTAFTAADLGVASGPATGAAESLALTVQKIYLFARDWKEMKAANELLAKQAYDLSLFKASPLLGCYLVANSDTAAVINMAVSDYGKTGWKFEVEMMVKKAQPVFGKARDVIKASRFEIAGLRGMKGTVTDRTAKTLGLPTGKLDGLIEDVKSRINRIGE